MIVLFRWYHKVSADPNFIPNVPGLQPSGWYRGLLKRGRAESMWTMWHIHHAYQVTVPVLVLLVVAVVVFAAATVGVVGGGVAAAVVVVGCCCPCGP